MRFQYRIVVKKDINGKSYNPQYKGLLPFWRPMVVSANAFISVAASFGTEKAARECMNSFKSLHDNKSTKIEVIDI